MQVRLPPWTLEWFPQLTIGAYFPEEHEQMLNCTTAGKWDIA